MKYLLFLLLAGCLDLDGLQSGLCGPQKISCFSPYTCVNDSCINPSKPDLPPITNVDVCISTYFPFFSPSWYPLNYWPNNAPAKGVITCPACTETYNATCSGRINKLYKCEGKTGSVYRFVEKSSVDSTVLMILDINTITKSILYQQIVSGDINAPKEICSRGQTGLCTITPDYRRSYFDTLCERL